MQYTSWKGKITKWYEDNLKLRGGYVRFINRKTKPSIANSEYVKSDSNALLVVARAGHLVSPTVSRITPHYKNHYGNDNSASTIYGKYIKNRYQKRIRRMMKGGSR